MKKRFLMATCVFGSLFSINANAQVVYLHKQKVEIPVSPTVTVEPVSTSKTITALPVEPNAINPTGVNGGVVPNDEFGKDVPISIAVTSIVPNGYSISWNGVDKTKKVSWSGGRNWKDILATTTEANGYQSTIKGKNIIITGQDTNSGISVSPVVSPSNTQSPAPVVTPVAPPPPSVADQRPVVTDSNATRIQHSTSQDVQDSMSHVVEPSNKSSQSIHSGVVPRTEYTGPQDGDLLVPNLKAKEISNMPRTSYAPAGGGEGIYYAAGGSKLDQVLQIWANANGWKVDYDARVLYPIDMPVTLNGDFMSVVRTLVRSVQEYSTPKPKYKFYVGNHVLHVYNFDDGS